MKIHQEAPRRAWFRVRCASALLLVPHDLQSRLARDPNGEPTGALEWHCTRCVRLVAVTNVKPSWGLLARLRRQLIAKRRAA